MKAIYHDLLPIMPLGSARKMKNLKSMLSAADFITIHVPELPETLNLISSKELKCIERAIPYRCVLFSTPFFCSLLEPSLTPNTILTSHIGGSTEEAQKAIGHVVAAAIIHYLTLGSTETLFRRVATFDKWLKVWKQIAKVLKRWSEPLRDLNSQRGANSKKAMILTKSFNFIHSSAKCHQNLVRVQETEFLTF
ncbi:hypothetical protein O181_085502 [Austropuccinia psidii MF-1]|uniref:D-isomer specific 2-hydroxyacid dehydrogenase NAD-binding domain-containing protein n=1 Tax=Austropuccinia psidii MF-1 TaxID=1389203 RepID=A0A9Q3ILR2_9BASI|nr:hypothetical protein [Austropuccinia psidii MF-1]